MASATVSVPSAFVDTPTFMQKHFLENSHNVIDLRPYNHVHRKALVRDDAQEVDALDLHECAGKLTGNVPGINRIERIALILADRYKPYPGVFGVMFDRGFTTVDDSNGNSRFVTIPREGCAIFLGAIKALRVRQQDFDREVEFTTIHELGHVFNLDHVQSPSSFMATSRSDAPYLNSFFKFFDGQRDWLAECESNPMVYPGGSIFKPVSGLNDTRTDRIAGTEIKLQIGVASAEFPCAKPVELDVRLEVSAATTTHLYVAQRLDPGYPQFRLWIVGPDGERRLFRSPRRYYAPQSRVLLTSQKPLQRDISIFESAEGTTFARPGVYQLQAEFDLGARGWIKSNTLSVTALANRAELSLERIALLSDARVRRFLYYRCKKADPQVLRLLEMHLETNPAGPGADDVRYAVIRALTPAGIELPRAVQRRVSTYIQQVAESADSLGARQYQHLHEIANR